MKMRTLLLFVLMVMVLSACGEGLSLEEGMNLYESVEAAREGGDSQDVVIAEDRGTPINVETSEEYIIYRIRLLNRREDGRLPVRYLRVEKTQTLPAPPSGTPSAPSSGLREAVGTAVEALQSFDEKVPYGLILVFGFCIFLFISLRRLIVRFYVSRSFVVEVSRVFTKDNFEIPGVTITIFCRRNLEPDQQERLRELGWDGAEIQIADSLRNQLLTWAVEVDMADLVGHLAQRLQCRINYPPVGLLVYSQILTSVNFEESQEKLLSAQVSAKVQGEAAKAFGEGAGLGGWVGPLIHALMTGNLIRIVTDRDEGGEA